MNKITSYFILALLLTSAHISFSQTAHLPNAKIEKGNLPLVMEHADSLTAMRLAGHLFLQGKVRFRHDSIHFSTERAHWDKNADAVYSDGGFNFNEPKGFLSGDRGSYQRQQSLAVATGNAVAKDSAGTSALFGDKIIFDRQKDLLTLPEKPLAHYYSKEDSIIDTIAIKAKKISYDRKNLLAVASDSVVITKSDMVITSDSGFYDRGKDFLSLKGNPKCVMEDYTLTGDSIFVKLSGKEVESVLVIKNAHGIQQSDAKGENGEHHSEVFGDTVFVSLAKNKVQSLYVNVNAKGLFYETDFSEFVNTMNGDRLDIAFAEGVMKSAEVKGNARSLYYYITPEKTIDGKNEAIGDTIFVTFDSSKVSRIKIKGNLATGIYKGF